MIYYQSVGRRNEEDKISNQQERQRPVPVQWQGWSGKGASPIFFLAVVRIKEAVRQERLRKLFGVF